MSSVFGQLLAPWNVEQKVLGTVETWIETYLAEVERQNGLQLREITRPASYNGGLDFLSYQQDQTPAIVTICQPLGPPELTGSGYYNQWFEIQLGCVLVTQSENDAREGASWYATALAAIGVQPQSCTWGGISSRTRMTVAPAARFLDEDIREVVVGAVTFESFIEQIVSEGTGPSAPTPSQSTQYPGSEDAPWLPWPTVSTVSVAVSGQSLS